MHARGNISGTTPGRSDEGTGLYPHHRHAIFPASVYLPAYNSPLWFITRPTDLEQHRQSPAPLFHVCIVVLYSPLTCPVFSSQRTARDTNCQDWPSCRRHQPRSDAVRRRRRQNNSSRPSQVRSCCHAYCYTFRHLDVPRVLCDKLLWRRHGQ